MQFFLGMWCQSRLRRLRLAEFDHSQFDACVFFMPSMKRPEDPAIRFETIKRVILSSSDGTAHKRIKKMGTKRNAWIGPLLLSRLLCDLVLITLPCAQEY